MSVDISNLSAEQIEALREILLQADKNSSQNVFDLSKPPKEQYVYQEFPKVMYSEHGHVHTVKSVEEEQAMLAKGWQNTPLSDRDYSRIDRNGMKAPKIEAPAAEDSEDAAQAKAATEEADRIAKAQKKGRRHEE